MKSLRAWQVRLGLLVLVLSLASSLLAAERPGQNRLQILRADYGAGNRMMDVTARLNAQIQGGQLYLQITNATMGGDPAEGRPKTLNVRYVYNGRRGEMTVREGEFLKLGGGYAAYQTGLQILRADYGAGSRVIDVTNRLNAQIQGGQLYLQVTNMTMGGDPAEGQPKALTVQYVYNGQQGQAVVREREFLRLGGAGFVPYGSGLQILRADYGAGRRTIDVTDRLNAQIRNGQLEVQVTNFTMGGDPAEGQAKSLNVLYAYNGQQGQTVVRERDFLRLGGSGFAGYQSGLQILRADYGAGTRTMDVTDRLNSQIAGGRIDLQVSNFTMGGDPAEGQPKGLNVQYVYNGQQGQIFVPEGEYLRLPAGMGTSGWGGPSGWGSYGVIPSGTQLSIRTNEVIDSKSSAVGQRFSGVMYADVLNSSGAVAIAKGSDVGLIIRKTSASDLVLDVESVVVNGRRYYVSTSDLEKKGAEGVGANRRTAEMVGGGAAAGAIIGAILAGGKGAAIGAAVGGAGGAGVQVLTQGKEVRVPAETVLQFKLDQDLRLQLRNW